jgi:ClpP class serine protease
MLMNDYRAAQASPDVQAIMLLMDTPGGAVSGINSFADTVFAGAKRKLTVAHVAGSAASAGYWIASATKEITLERTGIVGSIGVVAAVPKQIAPDSEGFVDIEIVSSNAPNKRPDPTTEDGQAQIRSLLDAIESEFISDVAKGRNTTAARVKAEFKQGGVALGAEAVKAGMADRVQSQESVMAGLRRYAANQRKLVALKQA